MVKQIRQLTEPDAVLLLEDGLEFYGWSFGYSLEKNPVQLNEPAKNGNTHFGFGEVVFNTAMCGYQEVLTDPSYWQQLVVMTYPHQGNYGVHPNDSESYGGVKVSGFVVHEYSEKPSNTETGVQPLETYLKENQIPAICGIDTRALTLHIRSQGAMRGLILSKQKWQAHKKNSAKDLFAQYPQFQGRDLILEVSTKKPYWFSEQGSKTVVALDFGVKLNLLREIAKRGVKVVVLPAQSTEKEILEYQPDGIFLSNGPGDPSVATYAINTTKGLLGKLPIFGVCMGHQILGLALGGRTFKMKFGHRGVNQPVFNEIGKTVEISSHNHGYAIDSASLPAGVLITHRNLNDGVCEGLECAEKNAYSVQYHPESAPGPHDSEYLFDKFVDRL